jgi:hypothetical protein
MSFVLSHISAAVDSLNWNPVFRNLVLMEIVHSSVPVTIIRIPFMALCKVDLVIGQTEMRKQRNYAVTNAVNLLGTINTAQCFCHLVICHATNTQPKAVPELRRLVAGFPPRRSGFKPGSGNKGFLLDKSGAGAGFLREFRFPLPIYIPSASPQSSLLSPEVGTIGQEWPQCQ